MPLTHGCSNTKKNESSHEKSKTKRGCGQNNTSQDKQFQTANCGRGRGYEDSDYEDTIELSLSRPFNLLPLNNMDLEELDSALALHLEFRNTSTSLREVQSNELENLSAPPHPEYLASRNLNTSTPLHEVQSNELENLLAPPHPEFQSNELENLSAPSHLKHPASRNLQSSKNLNTSTPLHEVQSNELENFSVLSCPELRDLNFSASLRSFNASTFPILPPCFNNMYGYDFPARHLAICESKCSSIC
ncbi:889_t:CDS:2 [Rhizophagus irregularis]|nr:889_t:CDS:2 [Rhizophagus irregularis]